MAKNWIAGITVGEDGRLRPVVQGGAHPQPPALADVSPSLGLAGGLRRRVSLSLHDLHPGSTTEYLSGLGLGNLSGGGQPTYEAKCSLGTLVIPAQLLVMSTLGANRYLRQDLLSGHGLGSLATALAETHHLAVVPTAPGFASLQCHSPQAVTRLEWLLAYPSAQAAWGSVYRRALNGQFDMRMPMADVDAAVRVRPVAGRLLVTNFMVMRLLPREAPCEFAVTAARREFIFNEAVNMRPAHRTAVAPTREVGVASSRGPVPLTDEEWLRVQPVVMAMYSRKYSDSSRKYPLREIIDIILLKVGTPYSWLKMPVERKLVNMATFFLSELKRRGVWEQVVAALT